MFDVEKIARERQTINQGIRAFFLSRDYLEVETPILVKSPGMEPNLDPFETKLYKPDGTRYAASLITSPEYSMKKLLARGCKKIFSLAKVFRNKEEFGGLHNPEFTLLEWYRVGDDYHACMDETEGLLQALGFSESIERVRMRDLFLEQTKLDLDSAEQSDYKEACKRLGIHTETSDTVSDLFYRLFLEKIEPAIKNRNIFLYDYPAFQAALSQLTPNGRYGQRFELYLKGVELCNGFTELTDAQEQCRRFEEEANERREQGKQIFPMDESLLSTLSSIPNPTYGNALGVDRLHMVLMGYTTIEKTLLFPVKKLFDDVN